MCNTWFFTLQKNSLKNLSNFFATFLFLLQNLDKTKDKWKTLTNSWFVNLLKNSKITKYDLKTTIISADNCKNMAEASNPPLNQNDNQSTIAFRNLKNAKLFALDIGGSLTKIAYYSTRISQRLLHRPDSKIR